MRPAASGAQPFGPAHAGHRRAAAMWHMCRHGCGGPLVGVSFVVRWVGALEDKTHPAPPSAAASPVGSVRGHRRTFHRSEQRADWRGWGRRGGSVPAARVATADGRARVAVATAPRAAGRAERSQGELVWCSALAVAARRGRGGEGRAGASASGVARTFTIRLGRPPSAAAIAPSVLSEEP